MFLGDVGGAVGATSGSLTWWPDPYTTPNFHITGVVAVSPGILTEVVGQIRADGPGESLRSCRELADFLVVEIAELLEIGVF